MGGLRDEALQGVIAILAFVMAIFMLLAARSYAGVAGDYTYQGLYYLLGLGYYLLPLILVALGIAFLKNIQERFDILKLIGSLLFLFSALGLIDIAKAGAGGVVGMGVAYPFVKLFAQTASVIFLSAILVASIIIAFNAEMDFAGLFSSIWWKKDEDEKEEFEEDNVEITVGEEEREEEKPIEKQKKNKDEKVKISASEEDAPSFIKTSLEKKRQQDICAAALGAS